MNYGIPLLPQYEPEDDFFSIKKATLRKKINFLEEQLGQQRSNLENSLKGIEYGLCECTNAIYRLPYGDTKEYNRIQLRYRTKLYQEKRKLHSDYLRMAALLQKDLLEAKLDYYSLEEKLKFMQ